MIRIGFEPMTYCLEGSCSIQLSYRANYMYYLSLIIGRINDLAALYKMPLFYKKLKERAQI